MGKEKLTLNMDPMEMIMTMSEGNPGAINVLMEMMRNPRSFMDILLCDSLDIRGSKLYMLHNDCCRSDTNKFNRTLMMLRCGVFTDEQIHDNLNLIRALPFIDDSIEIEGVPPYGEEFGPRDEKWEEFCSKNKESFVKRLNEVVEQEKQFRSGGPKF